MTNHSIIIKNYIKQALQVAVTYDLPIFLMGHGLGATLLNKSNT